MSKTILITGITGFLGSHVGRFFLNNGFRVIGIKRSHSDVWRCQDFEKRVIWVDIDELEWEKEIIKFNPELIFHAAWDGVASFSRDNYKSQLKNLDFLIQLLALSKILKIKKFISLGSQAEYGKLDSIAYEEQNLAPESAYGIVKVMASKLVEHFCVLNNISWYWLRVFSIFGEMESEDWLIPSLIKKLVKKETTIELSSCEQKYAYMYINDFVKIVLSFADQEPSSGIYNVSANNAIELREIISKIHTYLNATNSILDFGAKPQRENQSFITEGAMKKYSQNVAHFQFCDLTSSLYKTVDYYRLKFNHNLSK